ncbi:hypothetical protein [Nocardia wallacei]|uniref:hypothetical protein n=1 Tax=Nocardia wallacei TaxID=480035 RepID=UPI002453A59E|nr:hypothetical protein [Nocardia wallacei]
MAAAVNDWGQQYKTQTERLEAALEIGLAAAPRGAYGPVDARYSGETEYVTVNLPPDLARRVLRPVAAKKVSITRRLFTLLHFAMQAENPPARTSRTSPAPVQLTLTGTGG